MKRILYITWLLSILLLTGLLGACRPEDGAETPAPLPMTTATNTWLPEESPTARPAATASPTLKATIENIPATAAPAQAGTERAPQVRVQRNVEYGEGGGQALRLDVFSLEPFPAGQTRPAVLVIHGGGWEAGAKEDVGDIAFWLAEQGYVAFAVSYRLVDGSANRFPAAYDDVQLAVRWVRAHAADYQVNPERTGAIGFSAGGHLAALLGVTDTRPDEEAALPEYSSRVGCVVDVYGPTDLIVSSANVPGPIQGMVLRFMGGEPEEIPELYRQASPIYFVDQHSAAFLIVHGDRDPVVPVDQSRRFYQVLIEAGAEVEYLELEGEEHSIRSPENLERSLQAMSDFWQRCLGE
jgi:acetyl esterase/lipase